MGRFERQAEWCRKLTREAILRVEKRQSADRFLTKYYRQHRELGARDRRLFSSCVFSYFRWKGWLENIPLDTAIAMAYMLDAKESHPVIELLSDTLPLRPLGSAPLSEKAAFIAECLKGRPPEPSSLVPAWLKTEFLGDKKMLDKFILSIQKRPPIFIRVLLPEQVPPKDFIPVENMPGTYYTFSPQAATKYAQQFPGQNEIQQLASQKTGLDCMPQPGENWWDVCCGSGGKSFHLSALANQKVHILATDCRRSALNELHRRRHKNNLPNIKPFLFNALTDTLPNMQFDGILVDAPCSGIGTWSRHPDARWRTTPADVNVNAKRQMRMLSRVVTLLKPAGRLVYSVCTFTQNETENIIQSFLAKHRNYKLLKSHCFWPWDHGGDGMYVGIIKPVSTSVGT